MENKLTVDWAKAIEAYQLATPDQRLVLESIFGREAFAPSWQEDLKLACNDLGLNWSDAFPCVSTNHKEVEVINAYAALRILAKWVRGDWEPDWNDVRQGKYCPWFDLRADFSLGEYVCGVTTSTVGSRLCFPTKQMALDFATKYIDLYKIILTN